MRTSLRRKGAIATVFAMVTAGLVALLPASPAGAAVTYSNACINTAVPTDFSEVSVTLDGTAPVSVRPEDSFQLTNITQTVALPGAIFVAGYNLGLLQVGLNTVPGTVASTIEGTNTVQGVQNTSTENVSVTFTITDPDGTPGTGDETATDAQATVTFDDMTWTAGPAGAMEFHEDTVTPQSATNAGIRITAVIGGFLTVRFGCNPGTVLPGPPEVISLIDPAPSFASTVSNPVTTPTTEPPTTTTTTTEPPTTTTTTTEPPTTTTIHVDCDASMNAIAGDPQAAAGHKTVVAKVTNASTGNCTVSDANIGWTMTVAGTDVTGTVSPLNPGTVTLPPGASKRFRFNWDYGTALTPFVGQTVDITATVTVAGDLGPNNDSDTEFQTVK
jgi:hypothetical protein